MRRRRARHLLGRVVTVNEQVARVRTILAEQLATGGRRLGLIVAHDDVQAERRGSELLESVGLPPLRRLARIRPRPGESCLRATDLTDFVRRYGHEYVEVLLPHSTIPSDDERSLFEAACREEGCDVLWH